MVIRIILMLVAVFILIFLACALISFFSDLINPKKIQTYKIVKMNEDFVKTLIDKNLFPIVIASYISADNGNDVKYWEKANLDLNDIKNVLEKMEILNKDKYLKRIDDAIKITEQEIKDCNNK